MMATAAEAQLHEVAILRSQNKMVLQWVQKNCAGVTHAESQAHPEPGGSSMNWVVGHLVCVYNNVLPVLKQAPVMLKERLRLYERGSKPVSAGDAIDFDELMSALEEAAGRWDAGLGALTNEDLGQKAPFSPFNDPNETIRSVMGFLMFHQAYHAGQTGVLRRVTGKPGAI